MFNSKIKSGRLFRKFCDRAFVFGDASCFMLIYFIFKDNGDYYIFTATGRNLSLNSSVIRNSKTSAFAFVSPLISEDLASSHSFKIFQSHFRHPNIIFIKKPEKPANTPEIQSFEIYLPHHKFKVILKVQRFYWHP